MSQARILAAATVFIVILGAYYYYETVVTAGREAERRNAGVVISVQPSSVTQVAVESGADSFTLSRMDGRWRLTAPVAYAADRDTVERMLDAAKRIEREREIGTPERLEDYGLASPAVVIFTRTGGAVARIIIGAQNPAGTGYFVMTQKDGPVYLVDKMSVDPLLPGMFDVREKRLFTRPASEIRAVEYSSGKVDFKAEKSGEAWRLIAPVEAAADGARLDALTDKFTSVKAAGFIEDDVDDLGPYGLDTPEIIFTAVYDDGERRTILVGAKTEGGNRYAAIEGGGAVVRIPGDVMTGFPESVADVRDRRLVEMAQENVRRITIERAGGETVLLEREETEGGEVKWLIAKPQKAKADPVAVSGLVYEFINAQAASFIGEGNSDMARFGLDAPSLVVTMEGEARQSLKFAPRAGDQEGRYYAAPDGGDTVAEVGHKLYAALALGFYDLLEKRIFDFPSADIGRVVVERLGQVFDVSAQEDEYRLHKPRETTITANDWNAFVWRVTGLRYERKTGGAGPGGPSVVIRVYDKSGVVLEMVSIGESVKDSHRYLAEAEKRGEVYEINGKFVTEELIDALERLALGEAGP